MQFKQKEAWQCLACGRVLVTERGRDRHMEKCKYKIPVIKGQMSFWEAPPKNERKEIKA